MDPREESAVRANFTAWKAEVNRIVENKFGLGCDDIPDQDYRAYFDSGLDPEGAAECVAEVIAEEMGLGDEEGE